MTTTFEGHQGPQLVKNKSRITPYAKFVAEDLSRDFVRLGDYDPLRYGHGGTRTTLRDVQRLVQLGFGHRLEAIERLLDLDDGFGRPVIVRRDDTVRTFRDQRRSA